MTDKAIPILIAEDNLADALLTRRALKQSKLPLSIHTVSDGAEALDFIFRKGRYQDRDMSYLPQLIILDLKMPKVDGLEVLKQIRATPITERIPVIIFTSSLQDKDRNESYQWGANSFLAKPIDYNAYMSVIQQTVEKWVTPDTSQD